MLANMFPRSFFFAFEYPCISFTSCEKRWCCFHFHFFMIFYLKYHFLRLYDPLVKLVEKFEIILSPELAIEWADHLCQDRK